MSESPSTYTALVEQLGKVSIGTILAIALGFVVYEQSHALSEMQLRQLEHHQKLEEIMDRSANNTEIIGKRLLDLTEKAYGAARGGGRE